MTFLLFIFYVMLLSYSPMFLYFKVSDDSEMKQCKDLDKYYVCRERILRSTGTFTDCGPGWWVKSFGRIFFFYNQFFLWLIFMQILGRMQILWESKGSPVILSTPMLRKPSSKAGRAERPEKQ